eukprot:320143-Chlamydomonas_euryale.AAC.1
MHSTLVPPCALAGCSRPATGWNANGSRLAVGSPTNRNRLVIGSHVARCWLARATAPTGAFLPAGSARRRVGSVAGKLYVKASKQAGAVGPYGLSGHPNEEDDTVTSHRLGTKTPIAAVSCDAVHQCITACASVRCSAPGTSVRCTAAPHQARRSAAPLHRARHVGPLYCCPAANGAVEAATLTCQDTRIDKATNGSDVGPCLVVHVAHMSSTLPHFLIRVAQGPPPPRPHLVVHVAHLIDNHRLLQKLAAEVAACPFGQQLLHRVDLVVFAACIHLQGGPGKAQSAWLAVVNSAVLPPRCMGMAWRNLAWHGIAWRELTRQKAAWAWT